MSGAALKLHEYDGDSPAFAPGEAEALLAFLKEEELAIQKEIKEFGEMQGYSMGEMEEFFAQWKNRLQNKL